MQPAALPQAMEGQAEPVDLSTIKMAPIAAAASTFQDGISRFALLHTTIPTRPRTNVLTYTVTKGDNLFLIGEKFGIKPESVLWGNYDTLEDNFRLLKIGQILNILPVDGAYHQWKENDDLRKVATSYKVDPMAILEYPGNRFDLSKSTVDNPGIKKDTWIIIPGGRRPIKDWGPPAISRTDPAVAKYYGPGSCGKILSGAVGTGSFVWPVPSNHSVSGYDYTEIHQALDIGGQIGAGVVAADSGVVVYAGWSNFGYGNLLVLDHGNGWQTAYAHLNSVGATCGQSVMQGGTVATLGNSGNSTGPHLHFEMKFNGANANPHDFVQ
jgi:murein DD-endopeptidase MepM/ murein hydrolase activator NlpD